MGFIGLFTSGYAINDFASWFEADEGTPPPIEATTSTAAKVATAAAVGLGTYFVYRKIKGST
jgi:hypothetical protein